MEHIVRTGLSIVGDLGAVKESDSLFIRGRAVDIR